MIRKLKIGTQILKSGFEIQVGKKKYLLRYPKQVWSIFPDDKKSLLAESAAYFFTRHLSLYQDLNLEYSFPPSTVQSFFLHGLFLSLPEALLEFPKAGFTFADLQRRLYKTTMNSTYAPIVPFSQHAEVSVQADNLKTVIPLSFGKDSLLTLGLCAEIGLQTMLLYFVEPGSAKEVKNKRILIKQFSQTVGKQVIEIVVEPGKLRQRKEWMWGWDMLISQYTLLLTPFLYSFRASYLMWSQEYNYDIVTHTADRLPVIINFEETSVWKKMLTDLLKRFSLNVSVCSLLEIGYEFTNTYILYSRYPHLTKYHQSCDNDYLLTEGRSWCNRCEECARIFIYLYALGFDPKKTGISDMLIASKEKYFYIFSENLLKYKVEDAGQYIEDMLFAFYIVYRMGIKKPLIEKFKSMYLPYVEKRKVELFEKFTTIQVHKTIPPKLEKPVKSIYEQELLKLREHFKRYL